MSKYDELPEYCRPPFSLSLDRLVFRAVCTLDRERRHDTFSWQVMTCFTKPSKESKVTRDYLLEVMPPIFDMVEDQMDVLRPDWAEHLTQDEAETAVHNGLQFAARVIRRYTRRDS